MWIASAIVACCAAIPAVACTDGTTPECSNAEAGCAPDLSGNIEGGEAGTFEASPGQDAQTVDAAKPIIDSGGDALLDADAHG
ncbi:MAG: hypothetical protein ABI461_09180 [Polyangiaceae bacterium]